MSTENETVTDDGSKEPEVENYYWKLTNYVRMVAHGESNALLVQAPHGIGKSYQIMETLREERSGLDDNDDGPFRIRKVGGHATPVEVYHTLYDCRHGDVVFFDDVEGIVQNKTALSILKQATWSEGNRRVVEWRSSSDAVEVEEKFTFNGQLIFCFNDAPDNKIVDSFKNRTMFYELDFTYDERCELVHEVAKADYKSLDYEERAECAEFITSNSMPGSDVNLRTLFHTMDCRSFEPERWKEMACEFVDMDEEFAIVDRLLDEHDTVSDAASAFADETGKSERTFYNRKKEMENKGE